jgi:hypothetical protein
VGSTNRSGEGEEEGTGQVGRWVLRAKPAKPGVSVIPPGKIKNNNHIPPVAIPSASSSCLRLYYNTRASISTSRGMPALLTHQQGEL